jgi:hypothetical protein
MILPTSHGRPVVTLDSNCLFSVRYGQQGSIEISELLRLNQTGAIDLKVAVASALEAPPSDPQKPPLRDWQLWLEEQGIDASSIFVHAANIAFRTADAPDAFTYDHWREMRLRDALHNILFPHDGARRWFDFRDLACARMAITGQRAEAILELDAQRLMGNPSPSPIYPHGRPTPSLDAMTSNERKELENIYQRIHKKWLNRACDVEIVFIHISRALESRCPERAVLVTRDSDDILKPAKVKQINRLGYPGLILDPTDAVTILRATTVE